MPKSEYKIEKNVPPPTRSMYPFSSMEVGDSVVIQEANTAKIRAAACRAATKDKKFTCQATDGGLRIWRIA